MQIMQRMLQLKFKDISNLEPLFLATDHSYYCSQESFSPDTADFDFRHNRTYTEI
jgi:hypothetical protein